MKSNQLILDKTGAFLFRSPTEVMMTVNRELAVIMCIPEKKACGIVLYHPDEEIKELTQSLDMLYQKVIDAFSVGPTDIKVKVFGLRNGVQQVMDGVSHWLSGNSLQIVAKDWGGNASRKLLVECATGRVGVNYADTKPSADLHWISEGSARNRNPMDAIHAEVLILSENNVKRTLAKQAIEEQKHWSASAPKRPQDILSKKTIGDFSWSVVLLFDDLEDENFIESWVSRVRLTYPAVQFRWVGTAIPSVLKRSISDLKLLPPLEPDLLPEFKSKLRVAVFDHASTETSALLTFPRAVKR